MNTFCLPNIIPIPICKFWNSQTIPIPFCTEVGSANLFLFLLVGKITILWTLALEPVTTVYRVMACWSTSSRMEAIRLPGCTLQYTFSFKWKELLHGTYWNYRKSDPRCQTVRPLNRYSRTYFLPPGASFSIVQWLLRFFYCSPLLYWSLGLLAVNNVNCAVCTANCTGHCVHYEITVLTEVCISMCNVQCVVPNPFFFFNFIYYWYQSYVKLGVANGCISSGAFSTGQGCSQRGYPV